MADITDLTQVANANDRLTHEWVNAVKARFDELSQQLAIANQSLNQLLSNKDEFTVSIVGGLVIRVASGRVKLPDGSIASIAAGNLTLNSQERAYIFINEAGVVKTSPSRPGQALELAIAETDANNIVSLINFPRLAVASTGDLSNYATLDYVGERTRKNQALGEKDAIFSIPGRDTYYTIPLEKLSGNGLATNGVFTAPETGLYQFHAQIRVDTLSPGSNPDLAVKLSLFDVSSELGLPLMQAESARGDITLNAINAEPLRLSTGAIARLRIYLTEGVNARVREGSRVQVWRLD